MNALQIQYFLSVARFLNFSKAAEYHYTTQPSISRQIVKLETELGIPLFYRNSHGVELTKGGRLLCEEFQFLTKHFNSAMEQVKSLSDDARKSLSIGYLKETNFSIILPFIRSFAAENPLVALKLEGYGLQELRKKAIDGSIDIAFLLSFDTEDMNFLQQRAVFQAHEYLVISVSHPLAALEHITPADFSAESLIISSESKKGAEYVQLLCGAYGFVPKTTIQTETSEAVDIYIQSRFSVAVMDSSNRLFSDHRFRFIEIPGAIAELNLVAVWRKDNENSLIPRFAEFLPEENGQ